jgi:dipeptidyl aminopeptidase/acylaminoacyl peptidase
VVVGVILILAGGLLAHFTQTAGGIRIEDVRFTGAKGNTMSGLLYIPPNATPQIPAPGILAVHGYICGLFVTWYVVAGATTQAAI